MLPASRCSLCWQGQPLLELLFLASITCHHTIQQCRLPWLPACWPCWCALENITDCSAVATPDHHRLLLHCTVCVGT